MDSGAAVGSNGIDERVRREYAAAGTTACGEPGGKCGNAGAGRSGSRGADATADTGTGAGTDAGASASARAAEAVRGEGGDDVAGDIDDWAEFADEQAGG